MKGKLTLNKLFQKKRLTESEGILIQAIAALSVQDEYSKMTPHEIFDHIKKNAQEVHDTQ